MYKLTGTKFKLGEFNNYLIGGNITKEFALGEVGSLDDFYFVGTEPLEESPFPILSGNILDSNGELLFRLVRNVIVSNPKNCYKISGDFIGYEILDHEGVLILKVETKFEKVLGIEYECFVTTIKANFYNKNKELVFLANSGEKDESIAGVTKMMWGRGGMVIGYSPEEAEFVRFILKNNGKIYEVLRGVHRNEKIDLDGKFLIETTFKRCEINILTGDFAYKGRNSIEDCDIILNGNALKIIDFLNSNKKT